MLVFNISNRKEGFNPDIKHLINCFSFIFTLRFQCPTSRYIFTSLSSSSTGPNSSRNDFLICSDLGNWSLVGFTEGLISTLWEWTEVPASIFTTIGVCLTFCSSMDAVLTRSWGGLLLFILLFSVSEATASRSELLLPLELESLPVMLELEVTQRSVVTLPQSGLVLSE